MYVCGICFFLFAFVGLLWAGVCIPFPHTILVVCWRVAVPALLPWSATRAAPRTTGVQRRLIRASTARPLRPAAARRRGGAAASVPAGGYPACWGVVLTRPAGRPRLRPCPLLSWRVPAPPDRAALPYGAPLRASGLLPPPPAAPGGRPAATGKDLSPFFESTAGKFRTPTVRAWVEPLYAARAARRAAAAASAAGGGGWRRTAAGGERLSRRDYYRGVYFFFLSREGGGGGVRGAEQAAGNARGGGRTRPFLVALVFWRVVGVGRRPAVAGRGDGDGGHHETASRPRVGGVPAVAHSTWCCPAGRARRCRDATTRQRRPPSRPAAAASSRPVRSEGIVYNIGCPDHTGQLPFDGGTPPGEKRRRTTPTRG